MDIITNITEIDREGWGEFVRNHPEGNAFQMPGVMEIFEVPNYKPVVVACVEGKRIIGILAGVIQREHKGIMGYLTARATVWGGPLVGPGAWEEQKIAKNLIETFTQIARSKVIYTEFRNLYENRYESLFRERGYNYLPYINSLIILKERSVEDVLSSMSYNRRREINLSVAENGWYGETKSIEDTGAFYKILEQLYEGKVKIPLPPFTFFRNIHESSSGKIFIVKDHEQVIGGAACMLFEQKYIYTLYYCGLKDHNQKIFPSHLAIFAAIEYGIRNGFEILDLMGAGRADQKYGVREYKKRFGCQMPEYGRFLKVNNPIVYWLGKEWIAWRRKKV
jgi:hypothetical protein